METNILLESGTNELEILEFKVSGYSYGINVAKIREIVTYTELTPIPNGHPALEGAFMTRGETISVIDLSKTLNMPYEADPKRDMFLITNFNQFNTGFHVHGVVGIHRVSWDRILKPDATISNSKNSIATGIINLDGRLTIILDFEKIVADICPEVGVSQKDIEMLSRNHKNVAPILWAEDSQLLSQMIEDGLTKSGYTNITMVNNGMEAWELLTKYKEEGTLKEKVSCVVTDIEMPHMDGHHLLKRIKEDQAFDGIPVIIFSSLINDDMRRKGELLGADAQLSKNEMGEFIKTLDALLSPEKEGGE